MIKQYDSKESVQFLTADCKPIRVGGLVQHHGGYLLGYDRSQVYGMRSHIYRVLELVVVSSAQIHRYGMEPVRERRGYPDARQGKWFAGARLAKVVRDADGNVKPLSYGACDSFIHSSDRPTLVLDLFTQIEEGDGKAPVAGRDYSRSEYERLKPLYGAIDHSFDGYSNRPTACLGLALMNSSDDRKILRQSITQKGVLTEARLRQLTSRQRWLEKYVPDEAYFTDPFPQHSPYRQEVNYAEIASELTQMRMEARL